MSRMHLIEKVIFWCLVIWWIGQLMGCASQVTSRCVYPNQHSWCKPDVGRK